MYEAFNTLRESDVDKFKACSAATTLTAYLTGCEQEHVFQMPWHKLDQSQLPTMLDSYHSMHGDERVYSGDRLHTFYDVPADDAFFLEAIFLEETNFKYVESLVHEYKSTPKIAQRVHGSSIHVNTGLACAWKSKPTCATWNAWPGISRRPSRNATARTSPASYACSTCVCVTS